MFSYVPPSRFQANFSDILCSFVNKAYFEHHHRCTTTPINHRSNILVVKFLDGVSMSTNLQLID